MFGWRVRDRPSGRPPSGGGGYDFVGLQRSEGTAKWWGPAVLDAPAARPSSLKVREPNSPPVRSQVFAKTKGKSLSYRTGDSPRQPRRGSSEGKKEVSSMPSKRSAVAALQKLEADRLALDQRQKELEKQAAIELGQVILGTGLETFSKRGLSEVANELGKLGEEEAIKRLVQKQASASRTAQSH